MSMPPTRPPNDEVSLRELYLVVRAQAFAIVVFVAVVAVVVYAAVATRPVSYVAESTAAVSRAPISVQEEAGLVFRPELDVTYDTYQTLANSRGVLERVFEAVPAATLSLAAAGEAFSLERLAGSANQPSNLLAVAHRVRHGDAEVAAELATAWSAITIETVRALLNENLTAIERITTDGVAIARSNLEAAEDALGDLVTNQGGMPLPQRLTFVQGRLEELEALEGEITRLIRTREAEAASLSGRLVEDREETVVLSEAPEVGLSVAGALWTIEARLAALRAEQEAVAAQRDAFAAEAATLLPDASRFQLDLDRRMRARSQAQRSLDTLTNIEPTVAYVAQLAPTGVRVLSEAAVPTRPQPRNAVVVAALAAVAAAFAALVFVLLREAVRDPAAPVAPRSGHGPPRRGAAGRG
jgi:uncharacterized protein involved in exopolysaccharide biosynthesis